MVKRRTLILLVLALLPVAFLAESFSFIWTNLDISQGRIFLYNIVTFDSAGLLNGDQVVPGYDGMLFGSMAMANSPEDMLFLDAWNDLKQYAQEEAPEFLSEAEDLGIGLLSEKFNLPLRELPKQDRRELLKQMPMPETALQKMFIEYFEKLQVDSSKSRLLTAKVGNLKAIVAEKYEPYVKVGQNQQVEISKSSDSDSTNCSSPVPPMIPIVSAPETKPQTATTTYEARFEDSKPPTTSSENKYTKTRPLPPSIVPPPSPEAAFPIKRNIKPSRFVQQKLTVFTEQKSSELSEQKPPENIEPNSSSEVKVEPKSSVEEFIELDESDDSEKEILEGYLKEDKPELVNKENMQLVEFLGAVEDVIGDSEPNELEIPPRLDSDLLRMETISGNNSPLAMNTKMTDAEPSSTTVIVVTCCCFGTVLLICIGSYFFLVKRRTRASISLHP